MNHLDPYNEFFSFRKKKPNLDINSFLKDVLDILLEINDKGIGTFYPIFHRIVKSTGEVTKDHVTVFEKDKSLILCRKLTDELGTFEMEEISEDILRLIEYSSSKGVNLKLDIHYTGYTYDNRSVHPIDEFKTITGDKFVKLSKKSDKFFHRLIPHIDQIKLTFDI